MSSSIRWCAIPFLLAPGALSAQMSPEPSPLVLYPSAMIATADEPPATAPAKPAPRGPIEWKVGETKLKLGGYIKVDAIYDFDEIGSTDSFDVRTIPTGDGNEPGNNARLHARQTRLNLDVRSPTDEGEIRGFVEGDFFGDGNAFRLRHAYGEYQKILGGQTWTTFMDVDGMPETLDFESPVAFPQVRQSMIRYTHPFEKEGCYAAVAIEEPDSDVIAPAVAGDVEEPYPDLTGRVRWKLDRGHVQLGLFAGMARFDPDAGSPDDVPLYGANVSTRLTTWGKDYAIVQVTYGEGVGRYRGGVTAAPDADGDLEAIEIVGVLGSYQHHWCDEYRSNIGYSWAEGDLPAGAPPATSTEMVDYFFLNLIWQFTERAWTGIEYLHGTRETADSLSGRANRIQLSVRFDF